MKRILAIILALFLLLSLSALAERAGDVNGDGKFIVGYISKNTTDTFHGPINTYAQETLDALVEDGTIDEWTGILDGLTDPGHQCDLADDCIVKACDAVIILPAEAEGSAPAVENLTNEGIAVVVVNSKTNNTDGLATTYCGSDDVFAGILLARHVVENCPDGGKYLHIQGVLGNSAQIQRGEGMHSVMDTLDRFEMVGELTGNWNSDEAMKIAEDYLTQYGEELVAIICDNDDMSSGAQGICNDAGFPGIVCVGIDGSNYSLSMVKAGTMRATILQDGIGQIATGIDAVVAISKGEEIQKEYSIPFVLVTAENVDQYYTGA